MARRKSPFLQTNITRAVKGVTAAGAKVARIEFGQDSFTVITADGESSSTESALDAWQARRGSR